MSTINYSFKVTSASTSSFNIEQEQKTNATKSSLFITESSLTEISTHGMRHTPEKQKDAASYSIKQKRMRHSEINSAHITPNKTTPKRSRTKTSASPFHTFLKRSPSISPAIKINNSPTKYSINKFSSSPKRSLFNNVHGPILSTSVKARSFEKYLRYIKDFLSDSKADVWYSALERVINAEPNKKLKIDDKRNIQNISLLLRINRISNDPLINSLHNLMQSKGIPIIPFINDQLLHEFESGILHSLRDQKSAPPQIFGSLEEWKKKPWAEKISTQIDFYRVKKETSSPSAGASYCSIALSKADEELIKMLNKPQQNTNELEPQSEIEGTDFKEEESARKIVGHEKYVLDAAEIKWILQKDTHVDHIQPFALIQNRIQLFLKALNRTHIFEKPILENYPSYFIKSEDNNQIVGTKYLYMSYYNYLDNLWLMDHKINSSIKRDQDPLEWLQENKKFGPAFAQFISDGHEKNITNLVDQCDFIYTLKKSHIVKERYRGKSLGSAAKDWITNNPKHLFSILKAERSHLQSARLFYFIQDLFTNSNLSDKEKSLIEEKVGKVLNVYSQLSDARNELREVLDEVYKAHQTDLDKLFSTSSQILVKSPYRPRAEGRIYKLELEFKEALKEKDEATKKKEEAIKNKIEAEEQLILERKRRIEADEKIKFLEAQLKKLTAQ